jgi:undecaprenyl-diphosphatase
VNLLTAAVLGIVQGVTEFLPVSSTAHLLLTERLLGHSDPGGVFTVMIQLGSILAVMWLYRVKLATLTTGVFSDADARRFVIAIVLATIPALLVGALLAPFVKRVLYARPIVFAVAFIVGGIVMIVAERVRPVPTLLDAERTPWPRALGVGVCQTLALIPGVSRSGATIVGGMMLGLDRPAAAEFSFFLAMPTMTAAFAHDLLQVRHQLSAARGLEIGVGLVMAFISSLVVIKPFLHFVRRSGFVPFAWYRIALGGALLAAIAAGWMQG